MLVQLSERYGVRRQALFSPLRGPRGCGPLLRLLRWGHFAGGWCIQWVPGRALKLVAGREGARAVVRAGGAVWQREGLAEADLTATTPPAHTANGIPGPVHCPELNSNYFDCLATSYRHVVRHWPLGAPSAQASCCARLVLRPRELSSGTQTCDAASRHPTLLPPREVFCLPLQSPASTPPRAFFSIRRLLTSRRGGFLCASWGCLSRIFPPAQLTGPQKVWQEATTEGGVWVGKMVVVGLSLTSSQASRTCVGHTAFLIQ